MKKFLFLTLIFTAIISTTIHAQGAKPSDAQGAKPADAQVSSDPAAMLQQMKDKFKQPMVEKTGLTEAQADRVIEINFEMRQKMSGLRDLSEEDRAAKLTEIKAVKEKKYSEIPLTPEQIKSVYAFYEEMGKNRQKKAGK